MSMRGEKLKHGFRVLAFVVVFVLLCWVAWHLTMVPVENSHEGLSIPAASTNQFEDDGTNDADTINPRLPDSEMFKSK